MVSKIAIFRALYLGDMLCIIPAARAIRKAYPDAQVHLVGLPWQKDFVSRFAGYFNHFIEFPGWPGLPEQKPNTGKIMEFLQAMQRYRFDLVFQMQGNGVITNTLCMLWDAKTVCGLRKGGAYCPDDVLFPLSEDDDHEILRFLKLTDSLGIPRQGTHLEFPVMEAELARFKQIMHATGIAPGNYVCLHPGARDVRRRWPIENFVFIADQIAAQGFTVVLTGSGEEKSLLTEVQNRMQAPVINIVESFGHLSAGELAAVLKHARILVSNDTGVSHIAAALRVPSIILFSPYSDMRRWRPLNDKDHFPIPHGKTKDIQYVLECVMEKLVSTLPLQETLKPLSSAPSPDPFLSQ